MRVIALDPGGTTGVAIMSTDSNDTSPADTNWKFLELKGAHHWDLWQLLEREDPHYLIYERFQYQRRELDKGVSLSLASVEYIGVLHLWLSSKEKRGSPVYDICQTPAQAKNLWTDDKLLKVGLYTTGSAHIRDATRHLLYWLTVTQGHRKWFEILKG